MKAPPAPEDPRRQDELRARAGRWTRRVANPKRLARYLGDTSERWARYTCGNHPSGPGQRWLLFLDRAAADPRGRPEELITGALEVIDERRLRSWDPVDLVVELEQGLLEEIEAQAAEDVASYRLLGALLAADRDELAAALEAFLEAQPVETAVEHRNMALARVLLRRLL